MPLGLHGPDSVPSTRSHAELSYGYWLRENEITVRLGALASPRPVVLLSPTVAWIEPDPKADYPFDERIEVVFERGSAKVGPIPAVLMLQAMLGRRGPYVALRFDSAPAGRELLGMLREMEASGAAWPANAAELWNVQSTRWSRAHESVERPDRVRAIMSEITGRTGVAHRLSDGSRLCVRLIDIEGDEVRWRTDDSWGEGIIRIDMAGYNALYRVQLDAWQERGGLIVTKLPRRIDRIRQRLLRHGVVRSALTFTYAHPLWPESRPARREIRDVSFKAFSFQVNADRDLVFPGLQLSDVEVTDGLGTTVRLRAQVYNIAPFPREAEGDEPHLCTVLVTPETAEDERRWIRLVSGVLYVPTRGEPDWTQALWDLFESSGYFSLSGKSAEHFTQLKPHFMSAGKRAAALPHLFCQAVWLSRRGVEATVSVLKAYEGTWLGHQLAKRGGPPSGADPRTILRDIYFRGLEHPLTDPGFEWMLGYIESSVSWMNRSHLAFALKHESSGESMVLPFQLMEVSCSQSFVGQPGVPGGDFEVGPPTDAELWAIVGELAALRPRPYIEALNLSAERILLTTNIEEWRAAGLERDRSFLVARKNGRLVAVAVLESGELGTNLFRLLDGVRLFPLSPEGIAAFAPLLDAARAWYTARGRPIFVYYREYPFEPIDSRLGDLGEGRVWVISARLLPEFLEFVYQLTAPKRHGA